MRKTNKGWEFWSKFGERPLCLAPMAEINDLPFRLLVRRYNIKVCFTGMLNANQWQQSHIYHERMFNVTDYDHPLIGQVAGSNFKTVLDTAKELAQYCEAIEINCGCTQRIASRAGYGYFMVNTADKRTEAIEFFRNLCSEINVPVSIKMRIIIDDAGNPDQNTTVSFCKKLEEAGVSIIHLHGRYQHRDKTSAISIETIKAVVDSLSIPVIANGGVTSIEEANSLFDSTGAAGVSIGQQLLKNPTTFSGQPKSLKEFALEYIQLVEENPVQFFSPRKHLYNFFSDMLREQPGLDEELKETKTPEDLRQFVLKHCP